jgi:hypothetical protein
MRFQQSSKEPLRPQKAAIVINPESRTVDYFKQLSKYVLEQITQSLRTKQRRIFVAGKERERRRSSATSSEQ